VSSGIRNHKRTTGLAGACDTQFLLPPTPERIARAQQLELARSLETVNFRAVSLDKLTLIAAVLGLSNPSPADMVAQLRDNLSKAEDELLQSVRPAWDKAMAEKDHKALRTLLDSLPECKAHYRLFCEFDCISYDFVPTKEIP
jgi:hypothetical protein